MDDALALIAACEARIVNAWPAIDTLIMDGWAVRLAGGYSGRANSASALVAGARMDAALIEAITGVYHRAGLPACVRVTPLADSAVEPLLAARGFAAESRSIGMIGAAIAGAVDDTAILIEPRATAAWVRGVSAWQTGAKRDADAALMAIVGRVRLPSAFATLTGEDGEPLAYGMCAIDRGMAEIGSIVVAPEQRHRGHGRRLVRRLMDHAARNGGDRVFLQVEHSNRAAFDLYRQLGFCELYCYVTLKGAPPA